MPPKLFDLLRDAHQKRLTLLIISRLVFNSLISFNYVIHAFI